MGRLFLHIGTHKTATTSIQHYLFENRAELRRRGILYPDYELIGRRPHYAHLGIVNALSGQHDSLSPADARRFFAEVRHQARDFEVTIISAEPLYRHVAGDEPAPAIRDAAAYWAARHTYIRLLRDLLGDAEIVVVFRRQAEYAQSLYQEHIKVTGYQKNFKKFLSEFWFHFCYLQQLESWKRFFPKMRLTTFEELVAGGAPAESFARWLELPVADLPPARRINTSWPTDAVILKRLTNGSSGSRKMLQRQIDRLLAGLDPAQLAPFKHRSFFADAAAMRAFQAQFDADNARLKHRFKLTKMRCSSIFPAAMPDALNYGDKLNADFLAMILKECGGVMAHRVAAQAAPA